MRNEMFVSNERLSKFKVKMNWNQEELDNWMLAAKQKEEDAMALAACVSCYTLQQHAC